VDQLVAIPVKVDPRTPPRSVYGLYLPAPSDADNAAVVRHHLGTRNFFAWLYRRPLTGKRLGSSLVELLDRIHLYRPSAREANCKGVLDYLESSGYRDFRECVDHALAALVLAERFHIEDLWIDAFAHCVGMYQSLDSSVESAVSHQQLP
jgi:hypothetical protein